MILAIRFVFLLLLLGLFVWAVMQLTSEWRYRRRSRSIRLTTDTRGRNLAPPHQRVTDRELVARADELARAVAAGDITLDEAIGSLCRYGGAAVTPDRARTLLSTT